MPRIALSLDLVHTIEDVKKPNESITTFVRRCIYNELEKNYNISRERFELTGRNQHRNKRY